MPRVLTLLLALGCSAVALSGALCPQAARADDVTEASALFESGNEHFQSGMRMRGARRARELEAALDDYFASLRLVRSRNVLYNTALVLEQLERWDDAFNYWSEYLAVAGLSAEETADGTARREAVRPRVAVARIVSEPAGAEVWIDRRDLSARGHAPLELALPAGDHALWLVMPGFEDGEGRLTTTVGATSELTVALVARPVMIQILAPEARLLLDGIEIRAGASMAVAPGSHVLTLELDGRPAVERRFEVMPGGAPMVIDLTTAAAALTSVSDDAHLRLVAARPSRLVVDGVVRGSGVELELPLPPGEHDLVVESDGAPTWRATHTFGVRERTALHVDAHPTSDGLLAGRGIFGVLAGLALLASAGVSVAALVANDSYNRAPSQAGYDDVVMLNLVADIGWGITGGLGIAALCFLFADDGGASGELVTETEAE